MEQYRILWKFSPTGKKIYLPQIKGWLFWSRVPLQTPTSVDESVSPWNGDLDWCRKQIEMRYKRSMIDKKINIAESIDL